MNVLEIEDLRGGYTEVDILQGVDLVLKRGQIFTVAGTNGAGKSTLAKAIAGLLPRVKGKITLSSQNRHHNLSLLPAERRGTVGLSYVPQVANVFRGLTILENLQIVSGVEDRPARINEIFEAFPLLGERRKQRASSLSGGERQQLAFARALMNRPGIIVLDEPTAALSPSKVSEAFHLIRNLPELGASVLLVEQRARQALAISDYGCIMDGGRIAMAGPAETLLADDRAAELYLGQAEHGD